MSKSRKIKTRFLDAKERAIKEQFEQGQITKLQMLLEIENLISKEVAKESAKQQAIEDAKWEEHYLDCISECLSIHPRTGEPI